MVDNSNIFKLDINHLKSFLYNLINPLVEEAIDRSLSKYDLPEKEDTDNEIYFTSKQAASFMGISPVTLYKWRKKGKIDYCRLKGSNRIYYKKSELKKVLKPAKRNVS